MSPVIDEDCCQDSPKSGEWKSPPSPATQTSVVSTTMSRTAPSPSRRTPFVVLPITRCHEPPQLVDRHRPSPVPAKSVVLETVAGCCVSARPGRSAERER